jgi:hypothetical protein
MASPRAQSSLSPADLEREVSGWRRGTLWVRRHAKYSGLNMAEMKVMSDLTAE